MVTSLGLRSWMFGSICTVPGGICLLSSLLFRRDAYMDGVSLSGAHWQQLLPSSNHDHEEWRRLAMILCSDLDFTEPVGGLP